MLGSACGRCQNCLDTAPPVIKNLKERLERAEDRLLAISYCVPPTTERFDISEEFKVHCFDEIRRLLNAVEKEKAHDVAIQAQAKEAREMLRHSKGSGFTLSVEA